MPRPRVAAATVSTLSMHSSKCVPKLDLFEKPSRPQVIDHAEVGVVRVFVEPQAVDTCDRFHHEVRIRQREWLDEPVDLSTADRLHGIFTRADETDDDPGVAGGDLDRTESNASRVIVRPGTISTTFQGPVPTGCACRSRMR